MIDRRLQNDKSQHLKHSWSYLASRRTREVVTKVKRPSCCSEIMLKRLFLSLVVVTVLHCVSTRHSMPSGPCNSYEREKLNEGYVPHVYPDPIKRIPTIGVGFNLEKSGARQLIESVGADYDAVLKGWQDLTDVQIRALFEIDMETAVACVQSWPQWSSLGLGAQSALADMAFNLGCSKLSGFKRLRAALSTSPPDLKLAAREMRDSLWCRQVGQRCDRDVACMLQGQHFFVVLTTVQFVMHTNFPLLCLSNT